MLIDFVLCNQPRKKQDLFPHSPPRHHHFLSCVLASRDPVERKHTGSCLGIDSPNQIMPPTLNGEIPRISRGARGKSWEIWNDTRKTFYDLCTRSCIKKMNVSHSSMLSGDAAVHQSHAGVKCSSVYFAVASDGFSGVSHHASLTCLFTWQTCSAVWLFFLGFLSNNSSPTSEKNRCEDICII